MTDTPSAVKEAIRPRGRLDSAKASEMALEMSWAVNPGSSLYAKVAVFASKAGVKYEMTAQKVPPFFVDREAQLAEPGRARVLGLRATGRAGPAHARRPAGALSSSRMAQGDEGVASPAPANPELEKFQRWRSSPACRLEPPTVAEPCTWLQLVVAEDGSCSLGCRLCGARPPAPGRSAFADGTYKLRPDKRGGRRA